MNGSRSVLRISGNYLPEMDTGYWEFVTMMEKLDVSRILDAGHSDTLYGTIIVLIWVITGT